MKTTGYFCLVLTLTLSLAVFGTDQSWKRQVSNTDRERANPYSGQTDAISAGGRIFAEHCAACHGADALGRGKRPSLRTSEVQDASDGEIFWILKHGFIRRGMPSWSSLPDASRWQLVTYVKSLGVANPEANSQEHAKEAQQ
ncbi:MAG TPA: c-type cytochrome [Terriglobales bacterium]|nr:c-type cytochrome [Terriglobales bacterium]